MLDFVGRQMLFVDCSVIAERASLAEECGGLEPLWGAMLDLGDDGRGM